MANETQANEVTVTDITIEAKQILAQAMQNFCKIAQVKSEMQIWIEERTMKIRISEGLDKKEAEEKAIEEYKSIQA